jgi:hypothetical protein
VYFYQSHLVIMKFFVTSFILAASLAIAAPVPQDNTGIISLLTNPQLTESRLKVVGGLAGMSSALAALTPAAARYATLYPFINITLILTFSATRKRPPWSSLLEATSLPPRQALLRLAKTSLLASTLSVSRFLCRLRRLTQRIYRTPAMTLKALSLPAFWLLTALYPSWPQLLGKPQPFVKRIQQLTPRSSVVTALPERHSLFSPTASAPRSAVVRACSLRRARVSPTSPALLPSKSGVCVLLGLDFERT